MGMSAGLAAAISRAVRNRVRDKFAQCPKSPSGKHQYKSHRHEGRHEAFYCHHCGKLK